VTDWLQVLAEGFASEVPEGWSTTREVAEELGLGTDTVFNRLKRKYEMGEVEKQLIRLGGQRIAIWRLKQ